MQKISTLILETNAKIRLQALQLVHHTPLLVDCCLRKRGLLSRDFWFMSYCFYLECSVSPIYKLKGHVVMLIAQAQCTNKNRPSIPIVVCTIDPW